MCCVVRRVRERAYGLPRALTWQPDPLMDDQELDSRQSTGAVYWEGTAVNFKLDVASTIKFRRLFAPVGGRV
jgi:hypothetical protein